MKALLLGIEIEEAIKAVKPDPQPKLPSVIMWSARKDYLKIEEPTSAGIPIYTPSNMVGTTPTAFILKTIEKKPSFEFPCDAPMSPITPKTDAPDSDGNKFRRAGRPKSYKSMRPPVITLHPPPQSGQS
jgi:hypothetical protein